MVTTMSSMPRIPLRERMKSRPPKSKAEMHRECVEYFLGEGRPDLAAEAEGKSPNDAFHMYGRHVTEALHAEAIEFRAASRRFLAAIERRRQGRG
jgi:hypothetical protein